MKRLRLSPSCDVKMKVIQAKRVLYLFTNTSSGVELSQTSGTESRSRSRLDSSRHNSSCKKSAILPSFSKLPPSSNIVPSYLKNISQRHTRSSTISESSISGQDYHEYSAAVERSQKVSQSRSSLFILGLTRCSLYESKQGADVSVKCGSEVWKVHSGIMIARSSFFAAALTGPWKVS